MADLYKESYSEITTAMNQEDSAGDYVDVLEDRRREGVLKWVTRDWDCPRYKNCIYKSPEQLKIDVLNSSRVQNAIHNVSAATGKSQEKVLSECKKIIDEMAHNFSMPYVRTFGVFLANVWKRIYTGIYVDQKGIEMVKQVCSDYPMLYMPTHRSYTDFLLVSYICFHFNLPIPVIAAGLDFLGLKLVSKLMRNSGAFFIRRSFGDDKLYWAVFEEYVRLNVRNGYTPLEFFVEGTRSRTAKSLYPKIGLLQVVMDLYFTSQVPDINIVPIGITYDRTLEETLYAYELLGVPKPRESTTGLVKARSVLKENYGNVYVKMGKPISIRMFCDAIVNRTLHSLQPRFISNTTMKEQQACLKLAKLVLKRKEKLLVLSPFPLISLVISYHTNGHVGIIPLEQLVEQVQWLRQLIQQTGATVLWNNCNGENDYVCSHLKLHSNIVKITPKNMVELMVFPAKESNLPDELKTLGPQTVAIALPHMYLYHYGNQALQLIAHHSMIALIVLVSSNSMVTEDSVFYKFCLLQEILQKEFVFETGKTKEDFLEALDHLRKEGILQTDKDGYIYPVNENQTKLNLLASLLSPFIDAYMVTCQTVIEVGSEEIKPKPLVKMCQQAVENSFLEGSVGDPKALSLDMLNNAVNTLITLGAIRKEKRDNQIVLMPKPDEIVKVLHNLESFLPVGSLGITEGNAVNTFRVAKL